FVPAGYRVAAASLGRLGDVTATAAPLHGPVLALTGQLSAVAPTPETNAGAARCQVSPLQTWNLALTAPGLSLNIPAFVAASPVAGYTAVLVLCPGSPQSAPIGAKLLSATFTSSAITQPAAPGDYRWTSTWTPSTGGATVQAQSVRRVPTELGLTVTKK